MKSILALITAVAAVGTTIAAANKITVTLQNGGTMAGNLVGKTENKIEIETAYGIIALTPNIVTANSWKTAQETATSKPTGKYLQPNATSPKKISGSSAPNTTKQGPYTAGFADGRIVGKADAVAGKNRDGSKAMRLGKLHAADYTTEDDKAAYARGYHEGYNEGWNQRNEYEKRLVK